MGKRYIFPSLRATQSVYTRYSDFILDYYPQYIDNFIFDEKPIIGNQHIFISKHKHCTFNKDVGLFQDVNTLNVFLFDMGQICELNTTKTYNTNKYYMPIGG